MLQLKYITLLVVATVLCSPYTLGASVSSDGCADGSREGLDDIEVYRRVAACGASWNIPGVVQGTRSTAGCQKNGVGCSVHDACAPGWHVCTSPQEVDSLTESGTCSSLSSLYLTTSTETLTGNCQAHGVETVLGCGVSAPSHTATDCQPLASAALHADAVTMPWAVRGAYYDLGRNIVKRTADAGGVMCCLGGDTPVTYTIKPKLGPAAGGTRVTLTGVNFGDSASDVESVMIGDSPCIDTKWISSTSLECTTTERNDNVTTTTTPSSNPEGSGATSDGSQPDEAIDHAYEVVVTTKSKGRGVGLSSGEYTYTSPGNDIVAALTGGVAVLGIKPQVVDPKSSFYIYIRGSGWINDTSIEDIEVTVAGYECSELSFTEERFLKCLVPPLAEIQGTNVSTTAVVTVDGKGSATSEESLRFLQEGEKACDTLCSFTSSCDLSVGECKCRPGWIGSECLQPAILHGVPSSKVTSEGGETSTFTVKLAQRPSSAVHIVYTTSDPKEAVASPDKLVFNPGNWEQEQVVTITGVNDFKCDGDRTFAVVRNVASEDPVFDQAPATTNSPIVMSNKAANGRIVEIYPQTVSMTGDTLWIVAEAVCFAPVFRLDGVVYTPETRSSTTRRRNSRAVSAARAAQQAMSSRRRLLAANEQTEELHARVSAYEGLHGRPGGLRLRQSSNSTAGAGTSGGNTLPDDILASEPIELPPGQEEFTITLRNQTVPEGYRALLLTSASSDAVISSSEDLVLKNGKSLREDERVFFTAKCPEEGMFGSGAGCRPCPTGAVCPGGTRAWPMDGYWTPDEASGIVRACPRPESCIGGQAGETTCAPGYEGAMCGKCSEGYFPTNAACEPCPSASDATYYVIADVILWCSLALCGIFITHQMLFSYIVMLVKSLQSVAAVGRMGTERLPDWLLGVYEFLHLFSGDYDFVKPDCYNPTTVEEKFYNGLVYNVVIFLPLLLGVPLTGIISTFVKKWMQNKDDAEIRETRHWYMDRSVRCFVIFLSTIYLPATTKAVAMLACQDMGDAGHFMITEPSHRCYVTDEYWMALGIASTVLLLLTVSFPLFMINYLRIHKEEILESRFGERFNFLYEFYKPAWALFWAIEFAISCVIANASSVLVPHPKYQLSICTIVFGTKLLFIMWKGPFLDWITNGLQALLTLALLFGVNANYLLSLDMTRKVTVLRHSLPLAIVLMSGATVVGLFGLIIWMAFFKKESDVLEAEEPDVEYDSDGNLKLKNSTAFDIGFAVASMDGDLDESSEGDIPLDEAQMSIFRTLASIMPESEHGHLQRRVSSFFNSVIEGTLDGLGVEYNRSSSQLDDGDAGSAGEGDADADAELVVDGAEEPTLTHAPLGEEDMNDSNDIFGASSDDEGNDVQREESVILEFFEGEAVDPSTTAGDVPALQELHDLARAGEDVAVELSFDNVNGTGDNDAWDQDY
eukprot:TRINITY_DN8938_c0_g1_i3.p1 TRINITY_DN8938_c0_g1~~TRINITY_DN8938_c0_g1_i3.p1  ORF type:complete len:1435 (+),score=383.97 TRINITY_DN8938_c0_g1_i3:211-4515(+)